MFFGLLVRIGITGAHTLASRARSWPNMDEEDRGLEPAVRHLKVQELMFTYLTYLAKALTNKFYQEAQLE